VGGLAHNQSVHYPYPDAARDLSRWLPLVKWLAAIPHYVILLFLYIAAFAVVVVAWFAIVLTGTYPRGSDGYCHGPPDKYRPPASTARAFTGPASRRHPAESHRLERSGTVASCAVRVPTESPQVR
jgi:hypothetical protein